MCEEVPQATIRNAREDDWPGVVELLLEVFRRWPAFELDVSPLEHLRWKMRSDPIVAQHQWVAEIDGRIAATLLRIVRRIRIRGRDYMNWRYCDPAAGGFTVRAAEQQDRLLGYSVLRITEGEGYIADLMALPGRTDLVRSLIEDSLRIFRRARVERVCCWMISRHPYNRVLRRHGFIDTKRDVGFTYWAEKFKGCDLGFLADADARIHLTHGDSDWI